VALIAVICIVAVGFLGDQASDTFDEVGNSMR
jgi:Flp pilus assembly pilin Flp